MSGRNCPFWRCCFCNPCKVELHSNEEEKESLIPLSEANHVYHHNHTELNVSDHGILNVENINTGSGSMYVTQTTCEHNKNAENIQRYGEKLANILRTKANEVLQNEKKHSLLAEQDSAASCSSKQEVIASCDRLGHYHLRRCNHSLHQQLPTSNIDYRQLFRDASNQAKQQAGKCRKVGVKEEYELTHGNIVWMVGQAGVGKSTVVKCILDKILNERLYDLDLIFYLDCQSIDYKKDKNLLEFLTDDLLIHETYSNCSVELKEVLEMLDKSDKVGIILDNVNQEMIMKRGQIFVLGSSFFLGNSVPDTKFVHEVANAETFIYNLLNGNFLRQAKKLITTRLQNFRCLHDTYMPKFIVEVLGLNDEGQKHICHYLCEQEETRVTKVSLYFNDHPDLKRYCFDPVIYILMVYCICEQDNGHGVIALDSLTKMFLTTLEVLIKNSQLSSQNFQIEELCALAYSSRNKPGLNLVVFNQSDLEKEKIKNKTARMYLTFCLSKNINLKLWKNTNNNLAYFSHPALREFFIALHMILFADCKVFDDSLSVLDGALEANSPDCDYCKMIAKFLFGLCNSTLINHLENLILPKSLNMDVISRKKQLLNQHLFQIYQKFGVCEHIIITCSRLYEMHDDHFTKDVVVALRDEKEINCEHATDDEKSFPFGTINRIDIGSGRHDILVEVFSSDIPCLHYVLRANESTSPLYLSVLYPIFVGNAKKEFFEQLVVTLQSTNIVMQHIYLRETITCLDTFKALLKCLCKTRRLAIGAYVDWTMPVEQIQMLSDVVVKLPNKLHCLNLSGCLIGDKGLKAILPCLHNVKELAIGTCKDNHLTAQGIKDFLSGILNHTESLHFFYFYYPESSVNNEVKELFEQCKSGFQHFERTEEPGIRLN